MALRGWVYVFTTKSMPDVLKVGYSLKDPVIRARELENAGVPHPYVVEYEVLVSKPLEIEQRTHKELKEFREAKEWFRCSVDEAISTIRRVIGNGEILLESIRGKIVEVKITKEIAKDDRFIAYNDGTILDTHNDRFIAYNDGTILDTHMNLMWALTDNGSDIDWESAKHYCEIYEGGGYKDWRMPTLKELAVLYYHVLYCKSDFGDNTIHLKDLFCLTGTWLWSANADAVSARSYNFIDGHDDWDRLKNSVFIRVLPVRSN